MPKSVLFAIASSASKPHGDRRASRIVEVESRRDISYRACDAAVVFRARWPFRGMSDLPDSPVSVGEGLGRQRSLSWLLPSSFKLDHKYPAWIKKKSACRPSSGKATVKIRCLMSQSSVGSHISYSATVVYILSAHCLPSSNGTIMMIYCGHSEFQYFRVGDSPTHNVELQLGRLASGVGRGEASQD